MRRSAQQRPTSEDREWHGTGQGAGESEGERGSASLEFLFAGLVLLVPIVYLVLALGQIQSHTLGVEATARHLGRSLSEARDLADVDRRAQRIVEATAREYGMDADDLTVRLRCDPAGEQCPAAGAILIVEVDARAPLPLVPDILDLAARASVPVSATSVHRMPRLWGTR